MSRFNKLNTLLEICSRRGFFWPAFRSVYSDSPAGFWAYGPLGVRLMNKIITLWRRKIVIPEGGWELDTPCLMTEAIFEASGHLAHFYDKLTECKKCHARWRADQLLEKYVKNKSLEGLSPEELTELLKKLNVKCPNCGGAEFTDVKTFNLMFSTTIGVGGNLKGYLRPETTQGAAVEFKQLFSVARSTLPLVIAQVGRVFRNEISPRQSLIRVREFNLAEIQIFFDPEDPGYDKKFESIKNYPLRFLRVKDREKNKITIITAEEAYLSGYTVNKLITYWLVLFMKFFNEHLGFPLEALRYKELNEDERAHYAKVHWDLQCYSEEFGWVEVVNSAYRTDYDLRRHMEKSGEDLSIVRNGRRIIPHMYEPSIGLDRVILHLLLLNLRREKDLSLIHI